MSAIYQEDLREKNGLAVWVGDVTTEGELSEYLGSPFERDFGFLLNQEELPVFTRVFTEPRLHAHYNRPFVKVPVRQLIDQFELSGLLPGRIADACRAKGLHEAKTIVVFPHLRYRPELSSGAESPLIFLGNFEWPEGTDSWNESEKNRLHLPPLPRLRRRYWGESGRFTWEGIIRLDGWKGFATYKELSSDGWEPTRGCVPDGDFTLSIDPPNNEDPPSSAQIRAFEQLMTRQDEILGQILDAIFNAYPSWRENYLDQAFSRDGGKTWEKGSLFPPEWMPALTSPHDLKKLICPGSISIADAEQEVAGFAIGFSCKWDEEHGFGVRYQNGVVTEVGDIW